MPKSPRTRTEQSAKTPAGRRKSAKQAESEPKVDLPFVTGKFHAPPGMRTRNVVAVTRSLLPSPREAAYYGGLALLAVLEVIEWPVAVAIGVGAAVMGRGHGEVGAGEKAGAETGAKPETHEGDGHRRERTPAGRSTSTSRRQGTAAARRTTAASRRK